MQLDRLVERFQNKDPEAFEKLHGMYCENICGVINTIVRNDGVAQEICQDVFVKAWNNAETYNSSKGRFFTWILNIARNAAIDELRSKSHKNLKKNLSADYFVNIADTDVRGDSAIDTSRLRRLVKSLKAKCIELIDLLYYKGYTQKEAAEELDIPIGTVKTRNRSCISQLRKNLKL